MPPAPSLVAAAVSDGLAMYCPGVFIRGGSTYDYSQPPTTNSPPVDHGGYPPVGVVVGAGAAGALAGHLVFHSLLISVGLGVGAMGVAASADGNAGEIARSSGRMALAAFERTKEVNERYHLTERLAEGIQSAARGFREFDEEHAVVHNATEGVKQAWRDLRQFDEEHQLTTKAGNAVSDGLDKLAKVLEPPKPSSSSNRARDGRMTGGVYTSIGEHSRSRSGGGGIENENSNQQQPRQQQQQHHGPRSRVEDQQTTQQQPSQSSVPPWGRVDGDADEVRDWWGEDPGWRQ